jgi:hypothetical protein
MQRVSGAGRWFKLGSAVERAPNRSEHDHSSSIRMAHCVHPVPAMKRHYINLVLWNKRRMCCIVGAKGPAAVVLSGRIPDHKLLWLGGIG